MARRIDIELTSRRDDGTWTWRAPGARQPRGEVDGALLPNGASVGDVLRADAEFEIEGIVVTAVQAPKTEARSGPERIEILGSGRGDQSGVSVSLAPGRRRGGDDRGERGDRPRRGRPDGERGAGRGPGRDTRPRREGEGEERRPGRGAAERGVRPDGPETRARRGPARSDRPERPERGERSERPARGARPDRGDARGPRRITPAATFRNAALAELRPEQIPVAEQLLRGGIPAVRQAIEEQNARATSEGRATVSAEPLMAMAEELLPRMNLAAWKDRATAVRGAGKEAPLREVRSVVAGASAVALDEEGRALVTALRESLEARVTALREAWVGRIVTALDEGRVADALRVSARPPEPAARISADLAVRLSSAAGEAMAATTAEPDWLALLEAVVASPVRRTVKPAALPEGASEHVLHTARAAAGQVPELARLLGLPIPPPPGPRRPSPVAARRG
jgi:hypothetical protein